MDIASLIAQFGAPPQPQDMGMGMPMPPMEMSMMDINAPSQPLPPFEDELDVEPAVLDELQGDAKKELRELTVERLMDVYEGYKQWRDGEIYPTWEGVYRAYRGLRPANSGPYKTIYVIREIFRQMETLKPQISKQFFGGEQLFRYEPRHPGQEDQAMGATSIVHQQIKRKMLDAQLQMWLDTATLYGTSYLTYGWRKFKHTHRKISLMHRKDDDKTAWERKSSEFVYESPYVEFLKPWDVYTHPDVEDCRNSPLVVVRKVVSTADLKTLVREGWLDEDLTKEALEQDKGGPVDHLTAWRLARAQGYDERIDRSADGDEPHELLTGYTNDGHEYAILNSKHLVRAQKSKDGEIPMLAQRNYAQIGEHYGIPEPLIIMDEQRILNDFMGMYIDGTHIARNPMFKVSKAAKKDWGFASFRPGGAVYLDNMGDVEPLAVNPSVMNLPQDAAFIQNNMKLATGLSDELAGSGSSQRTATGLVRLQDAAGERMAHKVRLFMPMFSEVYRILYDLNARYLSDEVAVRSLGEDGKAVFGRYGPDVFNADVDVNVELANVMESNPETRQKWIETIKLFGMDPLINQTLLRERVFRAMGEKKPKMFLANPQNAQGDAMAENLQLEAVGILPDPNPNDNHQLHLQIHQMETQTMPFMALNPQWQIALQKHMSIHNSYMQQQMMAQGQQQMAPSAAPPGGSLLPEADMRTEAMFDNGATGAAQTMPMGGP